MRPSIVLLADGRAVESLLCMVGRCHLLFLDFLELMAFLSMLLISDFSFHWMSTLLQVPAIEKPVDGFGKWLIDRQCCQMMLMSTWGE
jgi:hypothetical protein